VYSAAKFHFDYPYGATVDGAGNVWVTNDNGGSVSEIPAATPASPVVYSAAGYRFKGPWGVAVDAGGNVWVADSGNNSVTELMGAATPLPFKVPLGP
jgi:DNA-binding beta-propeller fold protein YncE